MDATKMKRYRIYTEAVNVEGIKRCVNKSFDAYTIYFGEGVWEGESEDSLTVEVITGEDNRELVTNVASDIKIMNAQQAVLVTSESVEMELV